MARLIAPNGATVNVSDEKAVRLKGMGYKVKPKGSAAPSPQPASPHAGKKVADLRAEIEARNEGREEDRLLSLDGNKPDLIATLDADDAATAAADAETTETGSADTGDSDDE